MPRSAPGAAVMMRSLTGMTQQETAVFERRVQLPPQVRVTCYRLDTAMMAAEAHERVAKAAELGEVRADLLAMRARFRELRC